MISLTLFYSSLLPCILHVCLYIWSASVSQGHTNASTHEAVRQRVLDNKLGPWIVARISRMATWVPPAWRTEWVSVWQTVVVMLQREGIDEMWVVIRLLAGMSSGFGLRGESSGGFCRIHTLSAHSGLLLG